MGQVFLARSAGGRAVAVKVIRPELAADPVPGPGSRGSAARKVSGLFTAPVVDADVDGDAPWLATAYVAGPSLADVVATRAAAGRDGADAGRGAGREPEAIHATGLVHRDLKPSNVLLADDGPRVIDFGISRARRRAR